MSNAKDARIAELEAEVERLKRALAAYGAMPSGNDDEEEDSIDYIHWINEQWWPEEATHVTLDKEGGCCWWKLKPVLAPSTEYGWKARHDGGDLVERYCDPAMPFSGPKWRESLREKLEPEQVAEVTA